MKRTFLGLDLGQQQLRAVALRRKGRGISLTGGRMANWPAGVVECAVRRPNIVDRDRFVASVKELLAPLAGREDRIALSLPDQVGRVMFTEVDSAFKGREEGREVLKWQLKNSLPGEAREVQLDYQVLGRTEAGSYRIIASVVHQAVLQQYEEAVAEAGFSPVLIDFHTLSLYNYYRTRLDLGQDFVLVAVEKDVLSLQVFQGQVPVFHRCKTVAEDPARIFQEVNLSLSGLAQQQGGMGRMAVYVHTDWRDRQALLEALTSAFEREVAVIDPRLDRIAQTSLELPTASAVNMVAAVGAAERLL